MWTTNRIFACLLLTISYFQHFSWAKPWGWFPDEWGACTKSCGTGVKTRKIYCVDHSKSVDGAITNRQVGDKFCINTSKPDSIATCGMMTCPVWETGQWEECSVSCGKGVQTRRVACATDNTPTSNNMCDLYKRPDDKQVCDTKRDCEMVHQELLAKNVLLAADQGYNNYQSDNPGERYRNNMYSDGAGYNSIQNHMVNEPRWVRVGETRCSVTCGQGFRQVEYKCQAADELTSGHAKVFPDDFCKDAKPIKADVCNLHACPSKYDVIPNMPAAQALKSVQYKGIWLYDNYTRCSRSCGRGQATQHVLCVDKVSKTLRLPERNCDLASKPLPRKKDCNMHRCVPHWDIGRWSVCDATCGGGFRTRTVRCVRELSSDRNNNSGGSTFILLNVQENECPHAKPKPFDACGNVECPPQWEIGKWSQCDNTCTRGRQFRIVKCQVKLIGRSTFYDKTEKRCHDLEKPETVKNCGSRHMTQACKLEAPRPTIFNQNEKHLKLSVFSREIPNMLKVRPGIKLKMKCWVPTGTRNKDKIYWLKNGRRVKSRRGKLKLSRRGAIIIKRLDERDKGKYECYMGNQKLGTTIVDIKATQVKELNKGRYDYGPKYQNPDPFGLRKGGYETSMAHNRLHPNRYEVEKWTPSKSLSPRQISPFGRVTADTYVVSPQKQSAPFASGYQSSPHVISNHMDSMEQDRDSKSRREAENYFPGQSELVAYLKDSRQFPIMDKVGRARSTTDLTFKYVTEGNWDVVDCKCPKTDTQATQQRGLDCKVSNGGETGTVPMKWCENFATNKPSVVHRSCPECPEWHTGKWESCDKARCIDYFKTKPKRLVTCQFLNGTRVARSRCDLGSRPRVRKECNHQEHCVPVWRPGRWSNCTKPCGPGAQMRPVHCVWNNTKKLAGTSKHRLYCENTKRPVEIRKCDGGRCPSHQETKFNLQRELYKMDRGNPEISGISADEIRSWKVYKEHKERLLQLKKMRQQ